MHIFGKIGCFFFSFIECMTLLDINFQLLIQFEDIQMGKNDKNLGLPSERRSVRFKLPIDKKLMIGGTFRVMRITL